MLDYFWRASKNVARRQQQAGNYRITLERIEAMVCTEKSQQLFFSLFFFPFLLNTINVARWRRRGACNLRWRARHTNMNGLGAKVEREELEGGRIPDCSISSLKAFDYSKSKVKEVDVE